MTLLLKTIARAWKWNFGARSYRRKREREREVGSGSMKRSFNLWNGMVRYKTSVQDHGMVHIRRRPWATGADHRWVIIQSPLRKSRRHTLPLRSFRLPHTPLLEREIIMQVEVLADAESFVTSKKSNHAPWLHSEKRGPYKQGLQREQCSTNSFAG